MPDEKTFAQQFLTQQQDWAKQSEQYSAQVETAQSKIEELQTQAAANKPKGSYAQAYASNPSVIESGWWLTPNTAIKEYESQQTPINQQIQALADEVDTSAFYAAVYGQVPFVISEGAATSADEIFKTLTPPSSMTASELNRVRAVIDGMVSAITGSSNPSATATAISTVPVGTEIDITTTQPVTAPTTTTYSTPLTVHKVSTDELLKYFSKPDVPETTFSQSEWDEYLKAQGYTDEDIDSQTQISAQEIIDSWVENSNQRAAFREAVATMPEYKVTDLMATAAQTPGVALMDLANVYFEHVSQPIAGFIYKNIAPDLEKVYQDFRASNPDATMREALVYAWNKWEGPEKIAGWELGPTQQWVLKYMLMEGAVDPMTYVGWGIATRITKPIPYVGRLVGAAERGFMEVMDLPFDFIKGFAAQLPKSIGQRALMSSRLAIQTVDKYVTKATGKSVTFMSMGELEKALTNAVKVFRDNPQLDSLTADAGRALLQHSPITEDIVQKWAQALGTTLTPADITKATVESLDNLFEDFFTFKLITPREAAGKMLDILSIRELSDDTFAAAEKLMARRAQSIESHALDILSAKNPRIALMNLGDKNYAIHIAIEESAAYLERKSIGRIGAMAYKADIKLQNIWMDYIDKLVVKPFAQAYLTFGMYGPMNVVEDYIRSMLGGVLPKRMGIAEWDSMVIGLGTDPNMRIYGLSETFGEIARGGSKEELNNWILQLAALGNKGWAEKVYTGLVKLPGAYGMDIRRNFVAKRYLQILADLGGDQFQALIKTMPKDLSGLTSLNKSFRTAFKNDLYARVSTGNPDIVRDAINSWTRENIRAGEVNKILMAHPEVSPGTRQLVNNALREGTLFGVSPDLNEVTKSVNRVIQEAKNLELDDFIKGPEVATAQFRQLADFLTDLSIDNPQEMATLIQSLYHMSEMYGALPEQVLAQATVRSRGMKLAERRTAIDADLDRIAGFLDNAGADLQRVMDKLSVDVTAQMGGDYVASTQRLLDLMTAKREFAKEFRLQNSASRHDYFAGVNKRDMTPAFWDNFYNQMKQEYNQLNKKMAQFDGQIIRALEDINVAGGAKRAARAPIIIKNRALTPNDISVLLGVQGDNISRGLLDVMTAQNNKDFFVEYVLSMTRAGDVGFTREAIEAVYDQITNSLHVSPESMSWITKRNMELDAIGQELHSLYNGKLLPDDELAEIAKIVNQTADGVASLSMTRPITVKELQTVGGVQTSIRGGPSISKSWDEIRQQAMDEANKWYYKEFVDYTNANAFDQMMKYIYPYWSYESQRWLWLPRSFIKHPGTFTSFERWQNNSDYGYVHIPGTSIDGNPFRGTIYGALTSRLTRRDYPEYYDSLKGAQGLVELNDALSRWGFYPGAHISILISAFGGETPQMGETLPSLLKTPLNVLQGMFPDNEAVTWLNEHIFNDRFRDYMTILNVTKLGYDGTAIWSKMKEGRELTVEEQEAWNNAKSSTGFTGALFEQTGLFRLRTEEQYKAYEESAKVTEEMTGYTAEQQEWLRRHGYKVWDLVGGISPAEQSILQELDIYKWIGLNTPLLPSNQQLELTRLEVAWNDVETYTSNMKQQKVALEQEFLSGTLGPQEYSDRVQSLYADQRTYIDNKAKDNPLMTLEGRSEYYQTYDIAAPVMSPFKELLNLYFSIELKEIHDPETGELVTDWKTFFAQRQAIEDAIPAELKGEWNTYITRNLTPIEQLRRTVYDKYFTKYYGLWEEVLSKYDESEQRVINEYLYLERTGQKLDRQAEIMDMVSARTGNSLISSFRSEVSDNRQALRYANPYMDAWLFYWGVTSSFISPQSESLYREFARQTGRRIE
ncbi:MAG: hypothetical protein M0R06_00230 [Sphaerochaeta sp.]|jgi:hypothetical protein|nr:hypothetical protein [Sphaerochaeta sp.]